MSNAPSYNDLAVALHELRNATFKWNGTTFSPGNGITNTMADLISRMVADAQVHLAVQERRKAAAKDLSDEDLTAEWQRLVGIVEDADPRIRELEEEQDRRKGR